MKLVQVRPAGQAGDTVPVKCCGPLQKLSVRSFTSIQMFLTHTCSETSYRITDVECIARAQTLQLNLTGNGE